MARESIIEALGDIARDKGISRDRLQEVIQEAVTSAAKRKFKSFDEIEARINTSSGELEVFRYKRVTDALTDPENEISLDEARQLDSLAEPGDEVEYEIDNQELSRVIAQTARQLIFQKIREAERETIYENFKDRKGEILNGIVSRTERNRIFVTFNQVEAILYRREQIPNERYSSGEHIRVILLDVLNDPKEPSQLVISRADPMLLVKLFEMEVPEIYDGIVDIVTAAREPGRRAKIAVRSNDPDVDPVGACVGMRGSRVQSIISELRGEKIDIINWIDELPLYIANALAPAELTRIRIDEENEEIDVEVEPDQLSLAIGRQGQNVRLASKLIGYKINVNSTQDKTLSLEEQIRERLLASQAELAARAESDAAEEGAAAFVPAEEGDEPGTALAEDSGDAPAASPEGDGATADGAPAEEASLATGVEAESTADPAVAADAPTAEEPTAEEPTVASSEPDAAAESAVRAEQEQMEAAAPPESESVMEAAEPEPEPVMNAAAPEPESADEAAAPEPAPMDSEGNDAPPEPAAMDSEAVAAENGSAEGPEGSSPNQAGAAPAEEAAGADMDQGEVTDASERPAVGGTTAAEEV